MADRAVCGWCSHDMQPAEAVARPSFGPLLRLKAWDCAECGEARIEDSNIFRRALWWLFNGDCAFEGELHRLPVPSPTTTEGGAGNG